MTKLTIKEISEVCGGMKNSGSNGNGWNIKLPSLFPAGSDIDIHIKKHPDYPALLMLGGFLLVGWGMYLWSRRDKQEEQKESKIKEDVNSSGCGKD